MKTDQYRRKILPTAPAAFAGAVPVPTIIPEESHGAKTTFANYHYHH